MVSIQSGGKHCRTAVGLFTKHLFWKDILILSATRPRCRKSGAASRQDCGCPVCPETPSDFGQFPVNLQRSASSSLRKRVIQPCSLSFRAYEKNTSNSSESADRKVLSKRFRLCRCNHSTAPELPHHCIFKKYRPSIISELIWASLYREIRFNNCFAIM